MALLLAAQYEILEFVGKNAVLSRCPVIFLLVDHSIGYDTKIDS